MTFSPEERQRAFERKEFLWKKDRNQWHNTRAIEMRKKYKEKITELEGNDPWTLISFMLMSGSHWLLAVVVSSYLSDSYWKVALVGWALGGFWACSAGLAIHEASHQLVLKGKWSSFLAGLIA